ncbi:hypothetical protein ABIB45_002532 [Arthrobacter sp. UYCo732]
MPSTTGASTQDSGSSINSDYCGHCGGASDGGAPPPSDPHRQCEVLLQLEPPRYCATCRRRMKVQVTPLGWSADCSRHGRLEMPCNEFLPKPRILLPNVEQWFA